MNPSQTVDETRAELAGILNKTIAECARSLAMWKGVIALHNTVVRTSPGLYLVPRGEGYGVGAITKGVVMWSHEDAKTMAANARAQAGAAEAVAVFWPEALRHEIAASEELLASVCQVSPKVVAAARAIFDAALRNTNITAAGLRDELARGAIDGWLCLPEVRAGNLAEWSGAMALAADRLEVFA